MKKILIKSLFVAILVLFRLSLPAQNAPTPTRMERDMKIFSTMLDEYMEKSMGKNNMFNNNTKIEYLDGFGVLVKVSTPTNWANGKVWINNKLEKLEKLDWKLENVIENIVIPNVPEVRVRTGSGNVKVRTTTKNGRTTIITNDNGRVTTQEFDEKDRNKNQNKNQNKNYSYHFDSEQSKADIKQQKADMKQHKRDIAQHKRDMAQHKREIERSQDDVKRLQKDMQNENREMSREESREMKKAMKEAEKEMQQAEREMQHAEKEMQLAEKEMQLAEKEMQKEMVVFQAQEDSVNNVNDAKTEEAIREFLVQYADLITELKPNERIRIIYSGGKDMNGMDFVWNGNNGLTETNKKQAKSVEVFRNDIDSYKSSKNDKDFKARIKSVAPSKAKESLKIDMLSTIFDKVLADAKSENIKIQGKTQFAYLEDYSIKYDSKIYLKNKKYSSNYYDNDNCNNCDDDKDDTKDAKSKTDKDKEKDAKIAQEDENIIKEQGLIEKNGKEYFVLYGKTVAMELKANEKLIWEIDFGDKSKNPKILNKIIFYVSKNVLEDFDSRKITLEQAMTQVKTEKK